MIAQVARVDEFMNGTVIRWLGNLARLQLNLIEIVIPLLL